jgi:hypothetical protein
MTFKCERDLYTNRIQYSRNISRLCQFRIIGVITIEAEDFGMESMPKGAGLALDRTKKRDAIE